MKVFGMKTQGTLQEEIKKVGDGMEWPGMGGGGAHVHTDTDQTLSLKLS
jgi:hypothetical protein